MKKATINEDARYYADFVMNRYGCVWDSHHVLARMCVKHGKQEFMKELEKLKYEN
jgi:hypothetical protein